METPMQALSPKRSRLTSRLGAHFLFAPLAFLAMVVQPALPAAAAEPLRLDKGVIATDTTWSGTVILRGQNVVKKGATLTILPGTVVKFEWVDEDGDEIGDGELNVEGRIVARGTKDNMITFTSARENPKMKDWTFIMISTSWDSLLEYCLVEYAFSGAQIHYSTCIIRNSLFRYNWEGVRFSTTECVLHNNDFIENASGIYFQSHGSRGTINRNRFRDNWYAFFAPARSSSTVKFVDNNIEGSTRYNVNFGDEQLKDLDFTGNWWGSTDREKIRATFYDRQADPKLGRVLFEPFLTEPVADCGMRR
jgi:parallel beta-helix repeat protein